MTRSPTLPTALLVAGIGFLVAPALVPVQPVLYHDTGPGTFANESELAASGFDIVAYDDLSPRAQELYRRTLRNDGELIVPRDEGVDVFAYPTRAELGEMEDHRARNALETIVIERPPNGSLPPPDEPVAAAEHLLEEERERAERRRTDRGEATTRVEPRDNGSATDNGPTLEELRRQIGRYDQMTTRTDLPPTFAPRSLLRLLSLVAGIVAIGAGGYLGSKP